MKELTESASVAAFRARYEAGRSFDLDDDLEFCPAGLLNDDEVHIPSPFSRCDSANCPSPPAAINLLQLVRPLVGIKRLARRLSATAPGPARGVPPPYSRLPHRPWLLPDHARPGQVPLDHPHPQRHPHRQPHDWPARRLSTPRLPQPSLQLVPTIIHVIPTSLRWAFSYVHNTPLAAPDCSWFGLQRGFMDCTQ